MIRIKVDNKVLFRGELGEWVAKPPDEFRDAIKPGTTPKPYLKAVMIALSDAVVLKTDIRITVRTQPKGWTMEVVTP